MTNITIVTAFYDIGRGNWTPDKGLPHYLERSTDTYIERFSYLAKLDNELVVVTSPDIGERIKKIRSDIKIIEFNPFEKFLAMRNKIIFVQESLRFRQLIYPSQARNPEYWNQDYVLVTNLKPFFVNLAIEQGLVSNDTVAWIDFGYCRTKETLPKNLKWRYDFDTSKIHLFAYKDLAPNRPLTDIVASNDVHILGAKIVANKKMWPEMQRTMFAAFDLLYCNNLVDDDQTLFLLAARDNPELFEQHRIPDHQLGLDPFIIFKQFNGGE